jgi:thiol peroxidase
MAETALRGNPIHTSGDLPAVGSPAPAITVTKRDLSSLTLDDLKGQRVVISVFPSIDTPTCATSVRSFNERAASLDNTVILNVSADLPFAMGRFCGSEGIDKCEVGSTFRNPETLDALGTRMVDGPLAGLSARAVIVVDEGGTVLHSQLVPEIGQEPDYDAALAALG